MLHRQWPGGDGIPAAVPSGPRPSANLDDWIAIEPDETVVAYSGKVETGTGVRTALAQIVAEELDVALERVRLVMGDTGRTPDEGYTAGSMTVRDERRTAPQGGGGGAAGAAGGARRSGWRATRATRGADGVISVRGAPERSVSYGAATGWPALRAPDQRDGAAQATPGVPGRRRDARRVDLVDKFTGERKLRA